MTTVADRPLEEQIAQWRAYLRRRQAVHGPDVEELEGHLRDLLSGRCSITWDLVERRLLAAPTGRCCF
jgi:hypothetical protein